MNFVIDTSAYSRGASNHPHMRSYIAQADSIFVPAIVLGELVFGYSKGARTEQNMSLLQRFLSEERVHIAVINEKVAQQYGQLRLLQEKAGKPIAPNDLWIAATCRHLQLPLLTTDNGFSRIEGLDLVP